MSTYGALKSYVRAVTHSDPIDMSDALFAAWEPGIRARMDSDLRLNRMIQNVDLHAEENPFRITDTLDQGEVMQVVKTKRGVETPLEHVSLDRLMPFLLEDSAEPIYWSHVGEKIIIAPYSPPPNPSGPPFISVRIQYRATAFALTLDWQSNTYVSQQFNAISNLFLSKAYEYLRDFEASDRYEALYQSEVIRINEHEERRLWSDSVTMFGASQWV